MLSAFSTALRHGSLTRLSNSLSKMISSILLALSLSLVVADGGGKDIYNGIDCILIA